MAKITANGETELGNIEVIIEGDELVNEISCNDSTVKNYFVKSISQADGVIANDYHPEPNTMLQAYAFCCNVFNREDVKVDGNIGEIEYEEGVIY